MAKLFILMPKTSYTFFLTILNPLNNMVNKAKIDNKSDNKDKKKT